VTVANKILPSYPSISVVGMLSCQSQNPHFTVDNTMYLPKEHHDRDERLDLATKITSQWETTTKSTACIPLSMRYLKDLQWWPIEILRALGNLADEMPGIDDWNNVYDLLVEGKMKRMKDSSNTSSAEIHLSDIEFVRERVRAGEGKGKQNMIDTTMDDDGMFISHTSFEVAKELTCAEADSTRHTFDDDEVVHPADDTDDVDAAIEPGVTSGATLLLNATNALPPAILPSEDCYFGPHPSSCSHE